MLKTKLQGISIRLLVNLSVYLDNYLLNILLRIIHVHFFKRECEFGY